MITNILITYLLSLLTTPSSPELRNNSIGVAFLQETTQKQYQLKVVFPFEEVDNTEVDIDYNFQNETWYKFNFEGRLSFFDSQGSLGSVHLKTQFSMNFWCENDGGIQFRPTLSIKIPKDQISRQLVGRSELKDFTCFVVANLDNQFNPNIPAASTGRVQFESDFNQDGIADARIRTVYDDAENCDSSPSNNLMIYLDSNWLINPLRCCGP